MATAERIGLAALTCAVMGSLLISHRPEPRLAMGGCGPRSLGVISRQLGINRPDAAIFTLFTNGQGSVNFVELQNAAVRLGLSAEGRQMTADDLHRARPLGILHIDNTHFIALIGYDADGVQIADPAYVGEPRRETWSYEELAGRWDGRILVIERR